MRDYLEELCTNHKIQFIYTEDDLTALSGYVNGDYPCIRVNKIFKGCLEEVARAVVGYYMDSENEDKYLKVINDFLEDNVISVEYTIVPPDEAFKSLLVKHSSTGGPIKKKTPKTQKPRAKKSKGKIPNESTLKDNTSKKDESSLIELDISSIIKKDFWGEASPIKSYETFDALSDDVVELDVIVDDSRL